MKYEKRDERNQEQRILIKITKKNEKFMTGKM